MQANSYISLQGGPRPPSKGPTPSPSLRQPLFKIFVFPPSFSIPCFKISQLAPPPSREPRLP